MREIPGWSWKQSWKYKENYECLTYSISHGLWVQVCEQDESCVLRSQMCGKCLKVCGTKYTNTILPPVFHFIFIPALWDRYYCFHPPPNLRLKDWITYPRSPGWYTAEERLQLRPVSEDSALDNQWWRGKIRIFIIMTAATWSAKRVLGRTI